MSIAKEKKATARLVRNLAYSLYTTTLRQGDDKTRALFEDMKNPKVGDLVIETSTHYMQSRDPREGIGRLVAIAQEPVFTAEEARARGYAIDEPIPLEVVWHLRLSYDGNRAFRWTNASFIKVPEETIPF